MDNSIFQDEVREGFLVTAYRKRCWSRLVHLLEVFDEFAKACSIKYYLAYGSLLGAVRHKSIIPWDDDIDVIIKRDEYMRMKKCAREYFANRTDGIAYEDETCNNIIQRGYFAKLRDMNTTVAEPDMRKLGVFTGMFLDIFPLDVSYKEAFERELRLELWMIVSEDRKILDYLHQGRKLVLDKELVAKMWNLSFSDKLSVFESHMEEQWVQMGPDDKVGDLFDDINFDGKKSSSIKNWDETEVIVFEGKEYPAPKGYHQILSAKYGDYMKPVRGLTLHENSFMDPDTPCAEYISGRKRIPDGWESLM